MKKMVGMLVGLAVISLVLAGCSKSEQKEEEQAKEGAQVENWEPESVDLPEGHSADDGHDHSANDHSGHNH